VKIKRYKNAIKKIGAFTLALALTVSGLPNLGGIVAHATELDENTYLSGQPNYSGYQYIGSDASALVYGDASNHLGTNGGTAHYTFNIAAIVDDAHKNNATKGYYPTDANKGNPIAVPTLRTSYSNNWFSAYYAFGKPYRVGKISDSLAPGAVLPGQPAVNNGTDRVDPLPTYSSSSAAGVSSATAPLVAPTNFNQTAKLNGQVTTITKPDSTGNVEVRQEYKTSSDGRFIILEYTKVDILIFSLNT